MAHGACVPASLRNRFEAVDGYVNFEVSTTSKFSKLICHFSPSIGLAQGEQFSIARFTLLEETSSLLFLTRLPPVFTEVLPVGARQTLFSRREAEMQAASRAVPGMAAARRRFQQQPRWMAACIGMLLIIAFIREY